MKTKTDYTPGPWKVGDGVILSDTLNAYGNFIVAECPQRNEQDAANARLIAAAPELLEACERSEGGYRTIMHVLDRLMPDWRRELTFHETHAQIQTTIAKATNP